MRFPEKIDKNSVEMVIKEWELLGYRHRFVFSHLQVMFPASSGEVEMWANGPLYRDEGDHWKLNFPEGWSEQ